MLRQRSQCVGSRLPRGPMTPPFLGGLADSPGCCQKTGSIGPCFFPKNSIPPPTSGGGGGGWGESLLLSYYSPRYTVQSLVSSSLRRLFSPIQAFPALPQNCPEVMELKVERSPSGKGKEGPEKGSYLENELKISQCIACHIGLFFAAGAMSF